MSHFVVKCRHGVIVRTCKCATSKKTTTIVACPPTCPTYNAYVPRHAKPDIEEAA